MLAWFSWWLFTQIIAPPLVCPSEIHCPDGKKVERHGASQDCGGGTISNPTIHGPWLQDQRKTGGYCSLSYYFQGDEQMRYLWYADGKLAEVRRRDESIKWNKEGQLNDFLIHLSEYETLSIWNDDAYNSVGGSWWLILFPRH